MNINEKQIDFIKGYLFSRIILLVPDFMEAGEVVSALQSEVIEDITETADPENWHSGDIDISLARVLKKKLLI